jgi:hypothetical protein
LFAHAINARTLQLLKKASKNKASFPLLDEPVFKTLLGASWKSLAEASSIDEATRLLLPVAAVLEPLILSENPRGYYLRWKSSCPCCFDTKFPEPTLAITQEEFANVRPKFTKATVILRDCPVLDDSTGEDITKTIMVHVITVEPVVSTATASHFKFRSSDGDDHRGYEVIIPTMPTAADDVDEVWQLVRTSESDSSALSFIRIGCLDSLFGEQPASPQSGLALARHVGTLLRRAAPYREANSGRAPATVDAAIEKKGLRGSCLRVNRVGGPNGHAGGFFLQEMKARVCSPFISHCIPRNQVGSVITWPVASGGTAGGGVTEIIPFHMSVKMETGWAVTCPPHSAIPRYGFVANGKRVRAEFQEDEDPRPQKLLRTFTATVYNGARLLRQLGKIYPLLKTSVEAVRRTLDSENCRRGIHSAGALTPSSATRSRTAGERDSYLPGQAVFVVDSDPDSEATWPAIVVAPAVHNLAGKHFFVKLVGDSEECPPLKVPKSRLLPDAFGDALDRGDDDDVVRANFLANDKLIAERGRNSTNFLDVLTELGEYTTVFDSIFGHQDSFTHTDGALLENKVSFPQGSADYSIKMKAFLATGSVPPGALAYPKYKVATLSFALSDVELHCLDKDLHCSSRQMHHAESEPDKRSRRGAWTRKGDDFCFYPEGYALLDWNSRNNHSGGPYHMRLRSAQNNDSV